MWLVSVEQMRLLDRKTIEQFGTPGHVLMERAGEGATRALLELFPHMRRKGRRALVCIGKGNNGGDGLVMARLLRRRGVSTDVVLLGRASALEGDAALNLKAYRRAGSTVTEVREVVSLYRLADRLQKADVIVDAIFGIGLNSEVRGLHATAIEMINAAGMPVLAVDIPSGLNADTGQPLGVSIEAEATATFGFAKPGHVLFPGARLCGTVAVIDIGLAPQAVRECQPTAELLGADTVSRFVPLRQPDFHKGDCGHVLIIAGSRGKTGAAQMATQAALRSGAGLVTLVGPDSLYPVYAAGALEAMTETLPDRDGKICFDRDRLEELVRGKTAVVIGPGMGTHLEARRVVTWLLRFARVPLVLDADALTLLAGDPVVLRRAGCPTLLTPHPGEMARLLGTNTAGVQSDRVGAARSFAMANRCTLVLKGARTVIADPASRVWINPTGNPGMASGGMGDVLCGVLGGLLAQSLEPAEAACLGVYLHGEVADEAARAEGEIGLLASDVIAGLRRGLERLHQRHGSTDRADA